MIKSRFVDNKDCEALKYNVFSVDKPSEMVELSKFECLKKITRKDKEKMIRYAFILYDKASPLIKQFSDLSLRKKEAAVAAGYDPDKDLEILSGFYDFSDKDLVELTIEFLKDQNNLYWTMIVSNMQTFYEYQKALLSEVISEGTKDKLQALQIKSKLMDDCDDIAKRVDEYYIKCFGEGEVKEKARSTKRLTPENIANR